MIAVYGIGAVLALGILGYLGLRVVFSSQRRHRATRGTYFDRQL